MALNAAIEWNFTNGSSASINNGGGFKRGASGTDYSYGGSLPANDAPHLAFTDLEVKNAVYTRLYSSTHGASLVAGLIGNIIHVLGDGGSGLFTAGWYEVTASGNDGSNYVDVDRACATGNASDGVAKLGGALGIPSDAFYEQLTVGNLIFYETGTYTLTAGISVDKDGTLVVPFHHVGYGTTKWDRPTGNNRPLIAAGAYGFRFDDYWTFRNLRFTGTAANILRADQGTYVADCYAFNSSGTVDRNAIMLAGINGTVSDCEAKSTVGRAIDLTYSSNQALRCFVYDSTVGIRVGVDGYGDGSKVIECILDSCTTGLLFDANATQILIKNNTLYRNTTGLDGGGAKFCTIVNNIFESDTGDTGAAWDASESTNYWDYNNWHGNGTDVSNVTKGGNATAHDPEFEDASSDDFRLKTTSSCIGAGLGMAIGTGGNATNVDQGALQTAGGMLVHPGCSGGARG